MSVRAHIHGAGYSTNVPSRGRDVAKLFRKVRELPDVRACDLDAILAADDIEVAESKHESPGYAACLLREQDTAMIGLSKGQRGGRRRFSIAHELGHFHIPTHPKRSLNCLEGDFRARDHDAATQEWEANDFAAELLMPFRRFSDDVRGRDISVASAAHLASETMYDVSIMAAAWRMIQATPEAAAVVVSTAGTVSWIVKSNAFRLWLTDRNQRLHPDTLAASGFRGEGSFDQPRDVSMAAWLDQVQLASGTLLESTYSIASLDLVVSMLWHIGHDGNTDDE